MPELPEVETIVQNLKSGGENHYPLPGRRILAINLLWDRTLASPGKERFLTSLPGKKIMDINRRGKFIQMDLDEGFLFLHLRMSGDVRVERSFRPGEFEVPLTAHDRMVLILDGGIRFVFNDPRKFGRVWFAGSAEEVVGNLGPEPLSDAFTVDTLKRELRKRKRQIKPLLLDQHFIAGLGNIYTDEALHTARIHPLARSDSLSDEQIQRLWESIRLVLKEGIQHNGSSIDWVYRGGDFQNHFRVYQRTGQPCLVCGTPIIRMVIGQRATHFCPTCQVSGIQTV